jgi:hypothetical protein
VVLRCSKQPRQRLDTLAEPPVARAPSDVITKHVLRSLVVLAIVLSPVAARADFKEWTVSVWPAYALTYVDSRAPSGTGCGMDVGFGITESLTLKATGFVSWHPVGMTKTTSAGTIGEFSAMLGLGYALDVIRLVPSFDVAFGVLGIRGDAQFSTTAKANAVVPASTAFGVELGFALDYALTRRIEVGAVVRYHAFLTDITRVPVYLYVGPRLTIRFGG